MAHRYDVFISYRRTGGRDVARLLQQALERKGYHCFFDFDSLQDGVFNKKIFSAITEAPNFLLVLTEGSLDRCVNEGDWVRTEIEFALKNKRNIIPVVPSGNPRGIECALPVSLEALRSLQTSPLDMDDLFYESVQKLIDKRFVKLSLLSTVKNHREMLRRISDVFVVNFLVITCLFWVAWEYNVGYSESTYDYWRQGMCQQFMSIRDAACHRVWEMSLPECIGYSLGFGWAVKAGMLFLFNGAWDKTWTFALSDPCWIIGIAFWVGISVSAVLSKKTWMKRILGGSLLGVLLITFVFANIHLRFKYSKYCIHPIVKAISEISPSLRVNVVRQCSNVTELTKYAFEDDNLEVRDAAFGQIYHPSIEIVARYLRRIEDDKKALGVYDKYFSPSVKISEADEVWLNFLALNALNGKVRMCAIDRVGDQNVLKDVALKDVDVKVANKAISRITDRDVLREILQKTDKNDVRTAVDDRLKNLP